MTVLILFSEAAASGVIDGLRLCGTSLLPALFPFFVLTRFCAAVCDIAPSQSIGNRMQRWFGMSGQCIAPLLLSFIGGYPVGVANVCALYRDGCMTKQDAERCLVVCNNSGPAFFVAIIGAKVFSSVRIGLELYGIHVLTALLCARFFARADAPQLHIRRLPRKRVTVARAFSDAINGACTASLQICATVILFSVFLALLRLLPCSERILPFIGIAELTSGVLQLEGNASGFLLASFYMGWGGFCVHLQAMALWGELHPRGYLAEKLLHGLLSAIFAAALLRPTVLSVVLTAAFCAVCVVFPSIRKKQTGNLQKSTL